jgi:hypothetical protein
MRLLPAHFVLISIVTVVCLGGCGEEQPMMHTASDEAPGPVKVLPLDKDSPPPDIVLLVTGGSNGMMEVCNCSGPMPGGMARRSGLVISYRATFPHVLVLDSGESFWSKGTDIRNQYILKDYSQIGYDAVALGAHEWSAGPDGLATFSAAGTVPPLLSTTVVAAPGQPEFPLVKEVVKDFGQVKVAVLTYLPKESLKLPAKTLEKLWFSQPQQLVKRAKELAGQGCLIVLVVHGDDALVKIAAQEVPADLIVRGQSQVSDKSMGQANGIPVVGVKGTENIGVVGLWVSGGKIKRSLYRLEVADRRWPMDGRLIQTYQAYTHAALRQALDAERTSGLAYMSSAKCGRCHLVQLAFWKTTKHSQAYATLVRDGRQGDPNCLMCHTTGMGSEKGFYSIEKTPDLANVNCQDCHRFNHAEHRKEGFQFPKAEATVCATCHTPITDPKFDFGARMPKIRCPKQKAVIVYDDDLK